ncbi:MAG: hypothetical protein J6334_02335 [Kiritimatiellae bacterium]|nr:hypothetical protein [Kiritimatiellia bacterium]
MNHLTQVGIVLLAVTLRLAAVSAEIPLADFTGAHGWGSPHHVKDVVSSEKGLTFTVTGDDPWFVSPPLTFPAAPAGAKQVSVAITCEPTDRVHTWQLFYAFAGKSFNQADSCHLYPVGDPPYTRFQTEHPFTLPGSGTCRLRLDPPGNTDGFTVKGLSVSFHTPLWSYKPETPPPLVIPASTPLALNGDAWELRHDPDRIGAFRFLSRGKTVENLPCEPFVYLDRSGAVRTLDWSAAKMTARLSADGQSLETAATLKDADGHTWELIRRFVPAEGNRALRIETQIRSALSEPPFTVPVLHVPALTLLIERASQGHKRQAMLAGVEYLDDEPSSNEKEIHTPEHNRLIPAEYRLSAPMAVFTDDRNWLAATWNPLTEGAATRPGHPHPFATVFDTPDRLLKSGGHLLAFWAPAVGEARLESSLDLYHGTPFSGASHTVVLRSGEGDTVADALAVCIPRSLLPPPDRLDRRAALEQLARGWLDSDIREGLKVKHAIGSHFMASSVADAPVLMRYLAAALAREPEADKTLVQRLRTTADEMLAAIPNTDVGFAGVSHIRRPAPALVAGDIMDFLNRKERDLKSVNGWFASGKRIWKAPEGKTDLGSTLGADHCNGYSSMTLAGHLNNAVWSGNEAEIAKALAIVDKVTALYHGTVPRGAQPWEMPLHTPDIMASANLVHSYTLAYLLKPDPAYLREAAYWAYTGLSMVYLVPPPADFGDLAEPVGRYATCAVMGATHWVAPNWIGRPVQWCGLVYSAALWDLARITPDAKAADYWRTIAAGITVSGARQNHTADEPAFIGLLPDSWNLMRQNRFPIPINPGTVQENLAEWTGMPFYSLRALPRGNRPSSIIHVPGAVEPLPAKEGEIRCRIALWPEAPATAVITRIGQSPKNVTFNGTKISFTHDATRRILIIPLPARAEGELVVASDE